MSLFTPDLYLFWGLVMAFAGLGLGSFATAVIYRLPRRKSLIKNDKGSASRSGCPKCGHTLGVRDLIPFLSFCINKGKCRHCGDKLSIVYPLTELLTVVLCVLIYIQYGYDFMTPVLAILSCVLVSILMIDARHMIIPNALNGWVLGMGFATMTYLSFGMLPSHNLAALWGDAVGGSVTYSLIAIALRMVFSKIYKTEALGMGDVKFFGAAGFWLGGAQLPYFMILGGAFGVIYALFSRKITKKEQFPFGPALVMAMIVLILLKRGVFLTIS